MMVGWGAAPMTADFPYLCQCPSTSYGNLVGLTAASEMACLAVYRGLAEHFEGIADFC